MSKIKRKVPETLDFVKGLLISADEIPRALSGELEPRQVLALLAEPITVPRHKVIVGQQVNEHTIKELGTELQQTGPLAFRRSNGSLRAEIGEWL